MFDEENYDNGLERNSLANLEFFQMILKAQSRSELIRINDFLNDKYKKIYCFDATEKYLVRQEGCILADLIQLQLFKLNLEAEKELPFS